MIGSTPKLTRAQLSRLEFFSVLKHQDAAEIEFIIKVKETFTSPMGEMRFFAQADRQTNQKTAPYTPNGWGKTLLEALATCIHEIHRFPYQG